jgi:N-acyl-D-aspartate/D-glutamate deacylase
MQGRGEISGQMHLAHAQRRQPIARSAGRTNPHQSRGEHPGRSLPHQGAGRENWGKEDQLLAHIEQAQKEGLKLPDTYMAAGTGLDACLPLDGRLRLSGLVQALTRDPATREKIKAEVQKPTNSWENLYLDAGGPEHILLVAFKSDKLKPLTGKTLAEVARMRGKTRSTRPWI